ncbi:DUF167 family protein [Dolichospermum sp. ST_sed3]|nr:DUF167 family protein [Dolichospermum sp. ST_sed3]
MYIKVKAKAGAKKESVVQKTADHFEISVKEPAERNLANKRIIVLIRDFVNNNLNDKKSGQVYNSVRIVSGHHSPSKIISIN